MNKLCSLVSRQTIHKRFTISTSKSIIRNLSSTLTDANAVNPTPPPSINKEMAFGIQKATRMYVEHGVGYQKLNEIAKDKGDVGTLVTRWQRMMEAFLGTQVHVIAGLGYSPSEHGLRKFLFSLCFEFF